MSPLSSAHDLLVSDDSSTLHDDKPDLQGLTLEDAAEENRIRDDHEIALAKKAKAQKKKVLILFWIEKSSVKFPMLCAKNLFTRNLSG